MRPPPGSRACFHANPDEITFTASGTEGDNMVEFVVGHKYKPQDSPASLLRHLNIPQFWKPASISKDLATP